MISALISQVKGLAVFDDGRQVGYLSVTELDRPKYGDDSTLARAVAEAPDLEVLDVTDLPALCVHLRIRRQREEMLHAVLLLLDGECPDHIRDLAATALSTQQEFCEWTWIEGVLLSAPLPPSADATGAAKRTSPLQPLFEELPRLQDRIKTLQTAWHALPNALFRKETRVQARARVVRQGVFRSLLRGVAPSPCSPFSNALATYASVLGQGSGIDQSGVENLPRDWFRPPESIAKDAHSIWDVSAWRSSWLATEWPRLESTLACDVARVLTADLPTAKVHKKAALKTAFLSGLFDAWNSVRHHSDLSSSIDLIWDLALAHGNSDPVCRQWIAPKAAANRNLRHLERLSTRLNLVAAKTHAFNEPSLEIMILAFFGADINGPFKSLMSSITRGHTATLKDSDDTMWRALALESHLVFDSHAPFDSSHLLTTLRASGVSAGSLAGSYGEPLRFAGPLCQALALYALDRVFQQDGCVVHVLPTFRSGAIGSIRRRAVLLNFGNRRGQMFEGYLAWLLDRLQERLVADLRSGLPRERCGWTRISDLGVGLGRSEASVAQGVETLRRRATSAGFARETFQEQAGGIRLNPELAAPTNLPLTTGNSAARAGWSISTSA